MSEDWEVIYSYTRKQAIADGVLVDVSTFAQKEAGFKVPVALTSTVYEKYIKSDLPGQDETGRLWDLLFMLQLSSVGCESSSLIFKVEFQMTEKKSKTVKFKAVLGPGDSVEESAVITIMLPNED